ncbi:MAG: hydantoinase/oxoprolinase family protein [Chloroflexi bacterium]|nr:hydantoinase/oxoprolinase family protein [Chloroflexota bacterium]
MEYIIGIDTGGIFTDVTVVADGSISFYKALTTPGRLDGVFNALESAADGLGVTLRVLLSNTQRFIYSSTFATNLMVERSNEGKAGALATKGFGDTLIIRRSMKNSTWDSQEPYPQPLIPRRLTREVTERVDYAGKVITPLDVEEAKRVIDDVCKLGVEAVAICLLHAYANPDHERQLKKLVEQRFPNIFVYCSSDISPELREYERMSTTAFAAYVGPGVDRHLARLEKRGRDGGLKVEPLIMQSSGGVMGAEEARRKPVAMLFSGPAGGVIGSHFLSKTMAIPNFITTDMGGTSFDVGLVKDGEIQTSTMAELERWALMGRRVDLHTIGAGGGSIAHLDPQGIIKVGPRSAGAEPGPACYGRGGIEPTVTDADVVLGYIDPDYFLGGKMKLRADLAHKAVKERIADRIGMSPVEVASGIYQIINAKMVDAMRVHSVERGHDPRDFALLAFGGAGPVHAAAFHAQLGTKTLLIPMLAPVFSSMGVLATNLKHSYSRTYRSLLSKLDLERVNRIYTEMEKEARVVLKREGIETSNIVMQRSIDMSYSGQIHELEVPILQGPLVAGSIKGIINTFSQKYLSIFGYQEDESIIQAITFRLEGIGKVPQPTMERLPMGGKDARAAFMKQKEMYLPEDKKFARANVYNGDKLAPGNQISGPAIIQYAATTAVLFPGQKATCDEWRNLAIN